MSVINNPVLQLRFTSEVLASHVMSELLRSAPVGGETEAGIIPAPGVLVTCLGEAITIYAYRTMIAECGQETYCKVLTDDAVNAVIAQVEEALSFERTALL